ncbi:hypothetical protein GYMLUDRAFT_222130 [Collybiopsis luxurians FD-317 M1]|uniref:PEBP-like protein n=1 Tax=Collybiopsis luxurians FD-317 M1 TaxID=944289 RepID=A0A0D0CLC6_9AGAR|nr:hypothetical protein GYMLUDRAFT_222130 [Collybiopsis luxurians FD-317 M1]
MTLSLRNCATLAAIYVCFSSTAALAQVVGSPASVEAAFKDAKIVPDVISTFNPTALLSAVYINSSTQTGIIFGPGGGLTANQTVNEPEFWITYNDSTLLQERFVVALIDPDAPTPQNTSLSQFRHFIGGDFVISSSEPNGTARLTNLSAAISEYVSPGPPPGSDPHRYTILLFKQPQNFSASASSLIQPTTPVTGFNLSSFASSVGLGDPVAGTFFLEGPAGSNVSSTASASVSTATPLPSSLSVSDVKQKFLDNHIVPDITPSFNPVALLDVAYTSADRPIYVTPGGNMTIPETVDIPAFWLTYTNASLVNETFVIAIVDDDAPTPQNRSLSEFRHLILGDLSINGSSSAGTSLLVNSTPALSDYISPGPPNGSDPHRYTLLLYIQPSNFREAASALVNASTPITGFNLTSFAEAVGLGEPIAGNFFFEGPFNGSAADGSTAQNNGVARSTMTTGIVYGVTAILAMSLW